MTNNLIKFLVLFGLIEGLLAGSFLIMELAKPTQLQNWTVVIPATLIQTVLTIVLGIALFGPGRIKKDHSELVVYVGFALLVNFASAYLMSTAIDFELWIGNVVLTMLIFGILTTYGVSMVQPSAHGSVKTFAKRA